MKRIGYLLVVLFFALHMKASAVGQGSFIYYGERMTYIELEQANEEHHCVQESEEANAFVCFDTLAEVDVYIDLLLVTSNESSGVSTQTICSGGRWHLYSQSFYSNWVATLSFGDTASNHVIWSVLKDCAANNLRGWSQPNYRGSSYTFIWSQVTMIEGFPMLSAEHPR